MVVREKKRRLRREAAIFLVGFVCGNIVNRSLVATATSATLKNINLPLSAVKTLDDDNGDGNDDRVAVDYPEVASDDVLRRIGRWPNPMIVVGLPKAGTSSIAEYFRCGGVEKVNHYRCLNRACGAVIKRNMEAGRSPFFNTGRADVYSQIDVELSVDKGLPCYFPQVEALNEIHQSHPNSTFLLNKRNVDNWIESVRSWAHMDHRLSLCNITGLPAGQGLHPKQLKFFYASQIHRVRKFVERYPSHRLVEVSIDETDAGEVLESAFGIDRNCWGWHNSRSV